MTYVACCREERRRADLTAMARKKVQKVILGPPAITKGLIKGRNAADLLPERMLRHLN
jgi:hypothetical protein